MTNTIYMINNNKMHWDEHQEIASGLGGNIVCITNKDEEDIASKIATDNNIGAFFTGGYRIKNGSDGGSQYWRWIDGSTFEYTNWDNNQPASTEDRIVIHTKNSVWHDYNKEIELPAIYKIKNPKYIANTEKKSRSDHQKHAEELGMNLVSIHSQKEQDILLKLAKSLGMSSFWAGGVRKSGSSATCGSSDCWDWTDGSSWDWDSWPSSEPNSTAEDSLQISVPAGIWNDLTGTYLLPAIYMTNPISEYTDEYAGVEKSIGKHNKKITFYDYKINKKEYTVESEKLEKIEGFTEGATGSGGKTEESDLDKEISNQKQTINSNEKQLGIAQENTNKYTNVQNAIQVNRKNIEDDIKNQDERYKQNMKEKILYMNYETGIIKEINKNTTSGFHDIERQSYYQVQQLGAFKFLNQKILFWLYFSLWLISCYVLFRYTTYTRKQIYALIIGFALFPFIIYSIEYYAFWFLGTIYEYLTRNVYSDKNY